MTKSKITLNIPIEITIDVDEIKMASPEGARAYVGEGLIVSRQCDYEGEPFKLVERTPQVGDVVAVSRFGGIVGDWRRRVTVLHPDSYGDFLIAPPIGGNDYFDSWEDSYIAVYEPINESESNA
ncbi:hypothetical protein LAX75_12850 [Listeria cossartiae]|uniref:hypothetical protein n=1 Tax=Listeria cossartiae TaxID=2838249 RepID=UPI001E413B67|nr:hypothetical protein [Listeria cossartiae]MCD2225503.1 hypothetical protein [Listeria cossartiae]MCD2240254.1 hypothetical protein [Listeria cossartiae]